MTPTIKAALRKAEKAEKAAEAASQALLDTLKKEVAQKEKDLLDAMKAHTKALDAAEKARIGVREQTNKMFKANPTKAQRTRLDKLRAKYELARGAVRETRARREGLTEDLRELKAQHRTWEKAFKIHADMRQKLLAPPPPPKKRGRKKQEPRLVTVPWAPKDISRLD